MISSPLDMKFDSLPDNEEVKDQISRTSVEHQEHVSVAKTAVQRVAMWCIDVIFAVIERVFFMIPGGSQAERATRPPYFECSETDS